MEKTWSMSYHTIGDKHEATASIVLLWSFLEGRDLWHGLFTIVCGASRGDYKILVRMDGRHSNEGAQVQQVDAAFT